MREIEQGTEPATEPATEPGIGEGIGFDAAPWPYPEIRQLVTEASQALARLDAARLEELALSCKALNRDLNLNRDLAPHLNRNRNSDRSRNQTADPSRDLAPDLARDLARDLTCGLTCSEAARRTQLARQAREARGEMAVFARVLDGTRNNLNVLNRLRDLRAGRLEYSVSSPAAGCAWSQSGPAQMEPGHGDN